MSDNNKDFINSQIKRDLYNSYKEQCFSIHTSPLSFDEWVKNENNDNYDNEAVEDSIVELEYKNPYDILEILKHKRISIDKAIEVMGISLASAKGYKKSRFPSMTKKTIASDEVVKFIGTRIKTIYQKYQNFCIDEGYIPKSLEDWEYGDEIPLDFISYSNASILGKIQISTIKGHIDRGWLSIHKDVKYLVCKADVEKIRDRNIEENLIFCDGCKNELAYTNFLDSEHENLCNKCSTTKCFKERRFMENEVLSSVKNGFICTTNGFINVKETISLFPNENFLTIILSEKFKEPTILTNLQGNIIKFEDEYSVRKAILKILEKIK